MNLQLALLTISLMLLDPSPSAHAQSNDAPAHNSGLLEEDHSANNPDDTASTGTNRPELPMPEVVKAAAIQQLLAERAEWVLANTSVALPTAATLLTVLTFSFTIGFAVDAANTPRHHGSKWAAVGTAIGGGTLLLTSIVLWSTRTSDSRQEDELRRIDRQLGSLGYHFTILPWASPNIAHTGASGGLTLTVRL